MKAKVLFLGTIFCCLSGVLFAADATPKDSENPAVVAQVDLIEITEAELNAQAKPMLDRIQRQIHEVRLSTLKNMIEQQLLKNEAEARGISVADLEKSIRDQATPVNDEDVLAEYEKNTHPNKEAFEKVKGQIRNYLQRQKEAEVWRAEIKKLKKKHAVKILMPIPRIEVKDAEDPIVKGPETAPIQVTFFSDYRCGYCGKGNDVLTEVMANNPDKIRLTYRDFPLGATKAAEAARCARDQGKFWPYYELLFQNQNVQDVENLKKYAGDVDLDLEAFNTCLDSGKHLPVIQQDKAEGSRVGVSGTPAFFINGRPSYGMIPVEAFQEIIDEEIEASPTPSNE